MLNSNLSSSKLNKIYIRVIFSSIFTIVGLLSGFIPEISLRSLSISGKSQAFAQEYSPEEIANYARAGSQVEQLRREAYKEIKALINKPPGNIVCNQSETRENLKPEVQAVTDRFCNQILQIPQQNNLSNSRYNELTGHYEQQNDFYQQVQNALLKLQN